eukprot:SAG31_NODE_1639_length_7669_cov_13.434082_8_plen_167_part_00
MKLAAFMHGRPLRPSGGSVRRGVAALVTGTTVGTATAVATGTAAHAPLARCDRPGNLEVAAIVWPGLLGAIGIGAYLFGGAAPAATPALPAANPDDAGTLQIKALKSRLAKTPSETRSNGFDPSKIAPSIEDVSRFASMFTSLVGISEVQRTSTYLQSDHFAKNAS